MAALRLVVAVFILACSSLAVCPASADALREAEPSWQDRSLTAELEASLMHEARRAFVWRATWTGINAALALASVGAIAFEPASERSSLIVGAIASGVSGALTWALPLAVEADAERAGTLAQLPHGERRQRLLELSAHAALDKSGRVQWPWHLLNLGLSLVPATIIWAGYHQFEEGLITGLVGLTVGELTLLTQPTRLADQPALRLARLRVACDRRHVAVAYAFAW